MDSIASTNRPTANALPAGRIAWLWLLLGATLLPFSQFQTVMPLAAWLAPIVLLRFTRTQPAWLALPMVAAALYLATVISLRGVFDAPMVLLFSLGGIAGVISYGLDTWLARHLSGLARTLVFPTAAVTLDWLFGQSSLGTLGSAAYAQFGDLPLMQLTALTGIWGLVFLMAWLASSINQVWEQGWRWDAARAHLLPFAAVLAAALLYGSLRLALTPTEPTVRVAAISAERALVQRLTIPPWSVLATGDPGMRANARAQFAPIAAELLERTRAQARAGAKIVAWAEADAFALKEDEPALLAQAMALAREEQIYIQLGLVVGLHTDQYPYAENRAILIDPSGQVVWDYQKAIHPLSDALVFAPGPGIIPVVETPYGRLATVICFDADFPELMRQVGHAQVDILLVPARDWAPIDTMHARAATFRAIEQGVSMVRPTGEGVSIAVDSRGQVLGSTSAFTTDRPTMLVNMPMRGERTLTTLIGDGVAYGCMIGLALLVGCALTRRWHTKDSAEER